MKKAVFVFLSVFVLSIVVFYYHAQILVGVDKIIYFSPCDTPIEYSLGTIDPRFNVTENEFSTDIRDASKIWDSAYGKILFAYNPKSKFTINLVFDNRQALNNQINNIEGNLNQQNSNLKPQMSEYERRSLDFDRRFSEFKIQVDYWNNRGGAPPDEYKKLKAEQDSLKQEADALNEMAKSLNFSTSQYNSNVRELNSTISNYNQALAERPEEGLYVSDEKGQKIDIYFNISKDETVHTLAHEMGHALGIGHVQDANSVMYPKTNTVLSLSTEDIAQLNKACEKRSILDILLDRINYLRKQYSETRN